MSPSTSTLRSSIAAIRSALPNQVLGNEELSAAVGWSADEIQAKTGIAERRIAAPGECASDLATAAVQRLLAETELDPAEVEFLILCTQTPDHILPTTACIVQHKSGLPDTCAAFDVNLGCSGYVYCLAMADSFIRSGMFKQGLVVTADTYTHYVHPEDRSVRTLFGDAGTATWVRAGDGTSPISFKLGTDGSGARHLVIPAGGTRMPRSPETEQVMRDEAGNSRSAGHLYMNGAEVFAFTASRIPPLIRGYLQSLELNLEEIDWFVFHQANRFMLEHLRSKLKIPTERMCYHIEEVGNTVSSTIPLTLEAGARDGKFQAGQRALLVGFGVGYSWGVSLVEINTPPV